MKTYNLKLTICRNDDKTKTAGMSFDDIDQIHDAIIQSNKSLETQQPWEGIPDKDIHFGKSPLLTYKSTIKISEKEFYKVSISININVSEYPSLVPRVAKEMSSWLSDKFYEITEGVNNV